MLHVSKSIGMKINNDGNDHTIGHFRLSFGFLPRV